MKIATDFELPLFNIHEKRPECAHEHITGTKEAPTPMVHGNIQWDNAMMECASPVYDSCHAFISGVKMLLQEAQSKLPESVVPVFTDVMQYSPLQVATPQLSTFGCVPDYDAWTGEVNTAFLEGGSSFYRTAGFHLHIDTDKSRHKDEEVVKLLDLYLGVPLIIKESPTKFNRRTLYGQAGAFRSKDYGVEWRVPSPTLLKTTKLLKFIWFQAESIINNYETYLSTLENAPQVVYGDIRAAINYRNKDLARSLCSHFGINLG